MKKTALKTMLVLLVGSLMLFLALNIRIYGLEPYTSTFFPLSCDVVKAETDKTQLRVSNFNEYGYDYDFEVSGIDNKINTLDMFFGAETDYENTRIIIELNLFGVFIDDKCFDVPQYSQANRKRVDKIIEIIHKQLD